MLQWPEKKPDEVLDYQLDWANPQNPRLQTGEQLATSVWSVISGDVMINSSSFAPSGVATVWLSGGSSGTPSILQNRVTTTAGRTYEMLAKLRVRLD